MMGKRVSILQTLKNVLKAVHTDAVGDHKVSDTTRTVASLGLSLSGLLLFFDKAIIYFEIDFPIPKKYSDIAYPFDVFLWLTQLVVTPILIMFWTYFRPYLYAYLLPLFCYVTQVHFILIGTEMSDDNYSGWYRIGVTLVLFVLMLLGRNLQQRRVARSIAQAKQKIEEIRNAK